MRKLFSFLLIFFSFALIAMPVPGAPGDIVPNCCCGQAGGAGPYYCASCVSGGTCKYSGQQKVCKERQDQGGIVYECRES